MRARFARSRRIRPHRIGIVALRQTGAGVRHSPKRKSRAESVHHIAQPSHHVSKSGKIKSFRQSPATDRGTTVAVLVVLLLASIVFFTAVLIGLALMMRNRWDDLGKSPRRDR